MKTPVVLPSRKLNAMETETKVTAEEKQNSWCRCACIFCMALTFLAFCIAIGVASFWVTKILDSLSNSANLAQNYSFISENATEMQGVHDLSAWAVQKLPHSFGIDKKNQPVIFIEFGKWDLGSLASDRTGVEAAVKMFDKMLYRTKRTMRSMSTPENAVTKWAVVSDMEGYTLAKALDYRAIGLLQEIVKRYYAEIENTDYGFIINVSTMGRVVLRVMTQLLGSSSMEKFQIFGTNGWGPILRRKISDDQLPLRYRTAS